MNDDFPVFLENQWIFGISIALVLLGIAELGYRRGLRLHERHDDARRTQIGGVQGAVLGLLGLLLGFSFSMAVNRYEMRRDLVVKEANAIGTTWLRANMLPESVRQQSRDLLQKFTETRIAFQKVSYDQAQLAEGLRQSSQLESELWRHAETAAREAPTPITETYIFALNEMIDTDAERIASHRNRIPPGAWYLLVLVASVGCLTSAYGSGAQGARSNFTGLLLPLLITVVIVFIFDLLATHQGVVTINQQPMLDLLSSMRSAGAP